MAHTLDERLIKHIAIRSTFSHIAGSMKIAAIVIGSNAVRLQLARTNDGTFAEPIKRV